MTSRSDFLLPDTKVLAISSHVVHGYVGNTMTTAVLQSFGCDVSAINTVQFSNHLGYGHVKGTRATASEITEIWAGLRELYLHDFHILLSGYLPDAASIDAVAQIAQEMRVNENNSQTFFWILDPILGDNGKLYVPQSMVPAYKQVLHIPDLILPNHFEAETLSDVKIDGRETLKLAISTLHSRFSIPHVLITSLVLNYQEDSSSLFVAGSTMTSSKTPRIFMIRIPKIECFFSGTGDMFAALILIRLREAVCESPGLECEQNWRSKDDVQSLDLPLAKAAEKAVAGIHEVLTKSKIGRDRETEAYIGKIISGEDSSKGVSDHRWVSAKSSEIPIVRSLPLLKNPTEIFKAVEI